MARRWDGKESRWGERFLVDIPVEVSVTDLTGAAGRMKNLSLSGALVKADASLGLHSIIHVFISVPSLPRAASVSAYVSRQGTDGVGVEWCEYGPNVVKYLLRAPPIPLP